MYINNLMMSEEEVVKKYCMYVFYKNKHKALEGKKVKNMLITRQGFVKHIEVSRKKEDKYT